MERIAKANREQKPVDPPRPAQKGDAIKLDFVGSVDGVEFPGGAAQDYTLELGSGSFIPGFEDQLIGAEVGKPVDVKVTFPADYGNAELAGKDAVFKCTVKEIREFVDQPIDDELAKKNNFENLEAMRKAVSERIGQEYTPDLARHDQARAARQARRRATSSRCRRAWSRASSTRSGSASRKPRRTARRSSDEEKAQGGVPRRSPSAACGSACCWPMSAAPTTST